MEAKKEKPLSIIDQVKEYLETRIKLEKYRAIERSTSFGANLITDLVIIFGALLAFIFASITLALFLGDLLGGNWKGFGIVAAIYIIIVLLLKYNRNSLEKPITNAFIQKIFKNK